MEESKQKLSQINRQPGLMQQKLYLTIYKISKLKCAQPFVCPVSTQLFPDYTSTILFPMDLTTIISKIRRSSYSNIQQVYNDLLLISKNCFHYHQGKQTEKRMRQIVSKFINSVEHAWKLLKNDIMQMGLMADKKLLKGKQMEDTIENVQKKIKGIQEKKMGKLLEQSHMIVEFKTRNSNKMQNNGRKDKIIERKKQQMEIENVKLEQCRIKINNCKQAITNKQKQTLIVQSHKPIIAMQNVTNNKQSAESENMEQLDEQQQQTVVIPKINKQKQQHLQQSQIKIEHQQSQSVTASININRTNQTKLKQEDIECSKHNTEVSVKFDTQQLSSQLEQLRKNKLKKYRTLLIHYLKWIQQQIFSIKVLNKCNEHLVYDDLPISQEDQDDRKECYECCQFQQEKQMYKQLENMQSYKYLAQFLQVEFKNVQKGQINMKRILKILKEINLWLKLLASSYLNWRSKQEYLQVERYIIKCIEKIIEYKQLGPEFTKMIEQTKSQNLQHSQNIGVRTRSKYHKTNHYYKNDERHQNLLQNCLSNNRQKIRQLHLASRYSIANSINAKNLSANQEHQQFLGLLQQDQVYNSFKIVIVRDQHNPDVLRVLDKKDCIKKSKILAKNKDKLAQQSYESEQQTQQQRYQQNIDEQYCLPKNFTVKKKSKRLKNQYYAKITQQIQKQDQEYEQESDAEFLYWYSLKSNSLIVEKYKQKLTLNWDKVMQKIFGEMPKQIRFNDETTIETIDQHD